jgi:hypothetical protein
VKILVVVNGLSVYLFKYTFSLIKGSFKRKSNIFKLTVGFNQCCLICITVSETPLILKKLS